MTIEEKKNAIKEHCEKHDCDECRLFDLFGYDGHCADDATDEEIEKNYAYLFGKTPEETPEETASTIDHPSHYSGEKYECIEVMLEVFGEEATKHFCLLNAFKYLWRCGKKHESPYEDIAKAIWYLEKYRSLEEGAKENGRQDDTGTEGA